MPLTPISLGTPPTGVDGDDARTAFLKINQNSAVLDAWGYTGPATRIVTDCNLANAPGVWSAISGTAVNVPPNMQVPVICVTITDGYLQQWAIDVLTGNTAVRVRYPNGQWYPWDITPKLQTSPTDSRVDRALKVGGFGMGGSAVYLGETNASTLGQTGFYFTQDGGGLPAAPVNQYGVLIHVQIDSTAAFQIYRPAGLAIDGYERYKLAGSWGPWVCTTAMGINQTWKDVTPSRALGTSYTNTRSRSIQICACVGPVSAIATGVVVNVGTASLYSTLAGSVNQYVGSQTVIIPPGALYSLTVVNGNAPLLTWNELS